MTTMIELADWLRRAYQLNPTLCNQEQKHLAGWLAGVRFLSTYVIAPPIPPDGVVEMEVTFRIINVGTDCGPPSMHRLEGFWERLMLPKSNAGSSTPSPDNPASSNSSGQEGTPTLLSLLRSTTEQLQKLTKLSEELESRANSLADMDADGDVSSAWQHLGLTAHRLKYQMNSLSAVWTPTEAHITRLLTTGEQPDRC